MATAASVQERSAPDRWRRIAPFAGRDAARRPIPPLPADGIVPSMTSLVPIGVARRSELVTRALWVVFFSVNFFPVIYSVFCDSPEAVTLMSLSLALIVVNHEKVLRFLKGRCPLPGGDFPRLQTNGTITVYRRRTG